MLYRGWQGDHRRRFCRHTFIFRRWPSRVVHFCADADADGAVVATGDCDDLKLFDAFSGRFLHTEHIGQPVSWIAFSATAEFVAITCMRMGDQRGRVRVYRYAYPKVNGRPSYQSFRMGRFDDAYFREVEFQRHHCHRVVFQPERNDRILVTAYTLKTVVQAETEAHFSDRVGQILYIDVDSGSVLWAIDSEPEAPLLWPTNPAFSPSGSHFAIAARDVDGSCTVRIMETERGGRQCSHVVPKGRAAERTTKHSDVAMPMHVTWAVAKPGGVTVSGPIAVQDDPIERIAVAWSAWDSADESVEEVSVFRTRCEMKQNGAEYVIMSHDLLGEHSDRITCCDISPDGNLLASTSRDGTLRLYSLSDHHIMYETKLPQEEARLVLSPLAQVATGASMTTTLSSGRQSC